MKQFSGVVITLNEERNIKRCIQSLKPVVDEIVVIDSYSTDKTKDICLAEGVIFIEQKFLGYVAQKNFALQKATFKHIVSLDGDEALSEELQKSLIQLKEHWEFDGYYTNRLNNFRGQWIKFSDWYPNKKLRIFDKTKARWTGYKIHETVTMNNLQAKIGHLKGDILHYTYRSYQEMDAKTKLFSSISAEAYYEQGKKAPWYKLIVNPSWAFFKAFILRLGFLDGKNGFYICYQTAKITYLKYAKLRAKYKAA